MRYNPLGNTGVFVSELCLGTMTFGGEGEMWSKIGDLKQADADKMVGRALEAGINFIDTADVYSVGQSEIMTGQALKNLKVPREDVIVATKVFGETGTNSINSRGLTRHHIEDGVKASLKRLQLDHIDLYQVHGFDPATPIEETVRALDNLVQTWPRALRRRIQLGGLADRQSARHRRTLRSGALSVAAGVLHRCRA